jgi:TetR/AcrR family fatty acid metabolism transcriptional regulator
VRTKTPAQAEKILAAAARLFASQHFHEARMEDIADLAEVGKGTLYRYFKDKEELYMALLSRGCDQMAERLRETAETPGSAQVRLEALVEAILDFTDEHPHLLALVQHAEAMQGLDAELPTQQLRRHNVQLVEEIFEDARRDGEFTVEDPHLTALLLLGGLRPVIRGGDRPRPADLVHRIVDQWLHGAARPSRRRIPS